MQNGGLALLTLPDWYRAERETEKTIDKLTTLKELDYYLRNADACIRRLSLLRLARLKLKDSIPVLKEVLDDPTEHPDNKELAAWAIKAAAAKWDIDLFVSHRLLGKYTGNEKYTDLYRVTFENILPSLRYDFTSNLVNTELAAGTSDIRSIQEQRFETRFSPAEWAYAVICALLQYLKDNLAHLPALLLRLLVNTAKTLVIRVPTGCWKAISSAAVRLKPRKSVLAQKSVLTHKNETVWDKRERNRYYRENRVTFSPFTWTRKAVFGILYYLFTPLRLALKHKLATLALIAALYCGLTYTSMGRMAANRYLGIDPAHIQENAVQTVKQVVVFAWSEFSDLVGIHEASVPYTQPGDDPAVLTAQAEESHYTVTASKGLNIRTKPDASSSKVEGRILEYGTEVTYFSRSETDSSGKAWYFIKAPDGREGWVSAKWLKKKESE